MLINFETIYSYTSPLSVLYVEDEQTTQRPTSEFLSTLFKQVYSASNGKDAWDIYTKQSIQLVITDLTMPVLDGIQLVKNIRKINKTVPIIVLSGRYELDTLSESIDAGADSFVEKPIELEKFFFTLYTLLKQKFAFAEAIEKKEQKQEIIKSLFALSKDGIAMVDLEGKFLEANKAFCELFEYSLEELLDLDLSYISSSREPSYIQLLLDDVYTQGILDNFEKNCVTKSEKNLTVNLTLSLLPDKKRIIVNARDVTEYRELIEEVLLSKQEVENALRAKEVFFTNMSHEIRTPLNGIIAIVELMKHSGMNHLQKKYYEILNESATSLVTIINNILDYSKLNSNKVETEKIAFHPCELIEKTASLFTASALKNKSKITLDVSFEKNIILEGDPFHITQVLNNLVGNAVKFTNDGEIIIHAKIDQTLEGIWLIFTIEDNGIGIEKDKLHDIFTPFTQSDVSITRRYGGSGLGLSIAYQLVQKMCGEISVESQLGEGSIFSFALPFEKVQYHQDETHDRTAHRVINAEGKVLVVDDNVINREVIFELLSIFGLQCTTVESGYEAIALLNHRSYDLIFMDLQMPEMDGLETTQKIRKFNPSVPIIALTAAVTDTDIASCLDAGMNGHIPKPVDITELQEIIASYLPHDWQETTLEPEKSFSPTSQSEYIDFDDLKTKIRTKEKIEKFLDLFVEDNRKWVGYLREAPEISSEVLSAIHSLKGASGNGSILSLYELCVDFGKSSEIQERMVILKLIAEELEKVLDYIQSRNYLDDLKMD